MNDDEHPIQIADLVAQLERLGEEIRAGFAQIDSQLREVDRLLEAIWPHIGSKP